MPIPQEFIDVTAGENIKTIAGSSAADHARHSQFQSAHLSRMMLIGETATANSIALMNTITSKAAELILTTDVSEAVGLNKLATGNDTASQISALLAAVASGQQVSKTAGNTPPVTP